MSDMVMISERPAEVEDRAVPGHWAADLRLGKRPTGIATLVERTSRYTQLVALPQGHKAEPVRIALGQSIASLPGQLWRSLTWDQGKGQDHMPHHTGNTWPYEKQPTAPPLYMRTFSRTVWCVDLLSPRTKT